MSSGGHLASVHSEEENKKIDDEVLVADWAGWIGGHNHEGSWGWSDGTPWDFTNWMDGFPQESASGTKQCVYHMTKAWRALPDNQNRAGAWEHSPCANPVPYACSVPKNIDEENFHFKKIVKLTFLARKAGVVESDLWKEAANIKTLYVSKEIVTQGLTLSISQMILQPGKDRCSNGLLDRSHIGVLAEAFVQNFPSIFQNIDVNATTEDLITGFKIYTYLALCPLEAKASLEFYKHLVRTEDPRSIIQTSFKHLEDGFLPEKKYTQLAKSFFNDLTRFFNLQLGSNVRFNFLDEN